jgi:hypothetical protein
MKSPDMMQTPEARLRKLERRRLASLKFMICPETYGNGAPTGGIVATTKRAQQLIRTTVQIVPVGWIMAVAGATMRRTYG